MRGLSKRNLTRFLETLTPDELEYLLFDWPLWARASQIPPQETGAEDWTTWLILGGRGAGKTRAGAEWVRAQALGKIRTGGRIALVGRTMIEARDVMVDGLSGILGVHPSYEQPRFEVTRRRLVWPNGTVAELFSAEDPDGLRGHQFEAAWCDEVCKWRYPNETWDMLQFALRLGSRPRQVVTTTPRPIKLIKDLLKAGSTMMTRMSTRENAANLAPGFLDAIVGRYQGTRLGRQELDAELLEDREDALWTRNVIDRDRRRERPDLIRIVVAVDPPATSGAKADACGIIIAGRGVDGRGYLLEDATSSRMSPAKWAALAVSRYNANQADRIVVEVNQGGEMVEAVIRQVDPMVPVSPVRATRGKWLRAEPVAALYERGLVSHVGQFPELEDELCDFGTDGLSNGHSPDRLDALVWALTALMLEKTAPDPRIRQI